MRSFLNLNICTFNLAREAMVCLKGDTTGDWPRWRGWREQIWAMKCLHFFFCSTSLPDPWSEHLLPPLSVRYSLGICEHKQPSNRLIEWEGCWRLSASHSLKPRWRETAPRCHQVYSWGDGQESRINVEIKRKTECTVNHHTANRVSVYFTYTEWDMSVFMSTRRLSGTPWTLTDVNHTEFQKWFQCLSPAEVKFINIL